MVDMLTSPERLKVVIFVLLVGYTVG